MCPISQANNSSHAQNSSHTMLTTSHFWPLSGDPISAIQTCAGWLVPFHPMRSTAHAAPQTTNTRTLNKHSQQQLGTLRRTHLPARASTLYECANASHARARTFAPQFEGIIKPSTRRRSPGVTNTNTHAYTSGMLIVERHLVDDDFMVSRRHPRARAEDHKRCCCCDEVFIACRDIFNGVAVVHIGHRWRRRVRSPPPGLDRSLATFCEKGESAMLLDKYLRTPVDIVLIGAHRICCIVFYLNVQRIKL